jgi:glucose/arabinose dehydrogenase
MGVAVGVIAAVAAVSAQRGTAPAPQRQTAQTRAPQRVFPLPDLPREFDTAEGRIRVVAITKGLSHPWGLAFLPDDTMLVTERAGRLRVIHHGVLNPEPVAGVPVVHTGFLAGLLDIALHPGFATNHLVYLAYSKAGDNKTSTTAVVRGTWDGAALTNVKDVFVADAWSQTSTNYGSRLAFGPDGRLYVTVGDRGEQARAQNLGDDVGKVLRLNDDGSIPPDNPFVGKTGARPEIYSLGHRSQEGLAFNPQTGQLWENEDGPNGGDEVNIILPGRNYGWPTVSYGRDYPGPRVSPHPWLEGFEEPWLVWIPSPTPSGMAFYTGERFPRWKGNLFVGSMRYGEITGTGHLERIALNDKGEELRREWLLTELHQRIRDVRQGPDGLLYVLTEENDAALLRIEPAT